MSRHESSAPSADLFNVYAYTDPNDPDCTEQEFAQSFETLTEAHAYGNRVFGGSYQVQSGLDGRVYNTGDLSGS